MGATHDRGDFLEQLCQTWAMSKRRGVRIIESKINSVHGIDFAMETQDGDVFIFEVKSATGSLSEGQFTHAWLRERIRAPLREAIVRAVIRRRYVIREVVRVIERAGREPDFRIGSPTDQLQWEDLFPTEPMPVLAMVGKSARAISGQIEVTHQMQGFGLNETHVYRMAQAVLSAGLLRSILDNAMYPAIVPHTHVILENGVKRYSRDLGEWDKHLAAKDDSYSGTVLQLACSQCRASFFGFANEQACSPCQNQLGNAIGKQKTALICAAQAVSLGGNDAAKWKAGNEKMHQLLAEWKAIGHAGEAEGALWAQFTAARQRFFEQRQQYFDQQAQVRASNGREKQALLAAARSAAQSSDWKGGSEKMKDLMQRWKNIGPADKDQDQTLWEQFNAARNQFFERASAHYAQQERQRTQHAASKERLISRAENAARSDDWKNTGDLMQELMQQWKNTGSAGRDHDDGLWLRFNTARQRFFDRRTAWFEQQDRLRAQNAQIKKRLIAQAQAWAHSSDWRAGGDAMRQLMADWKNTGPAGRDDDDQLWNQFSLARQVFFDRREAYFDQMKQEHERNRRVKLGLIDQAERYSDSSDWKNTSALMRELMDQWRGVGSAGQEFDDDLWRRFQAARQEFYDNQDRFFAANRR